MTSREECLFSWRPLVSKVWRFGFKTSRFQNFSIFLWSRIRYRKNLVSKKVSDSVSKKFGIEKSIGFGIGKIWYRKKVSDSVSFRFWVSSHTVACVAWLLLSCPDNVDRDLEILLWHSGIGLSGNKTCSLTSNALQHYVKSSWRSCPPTSLFTMQQIPYKKEKNLDDCLLLLLPHVLTCLLLLICQRLI